MQDIINEINRLRNEQNAIILAHNYQAVDIQDIADLRGDSLQLAIAAGKSDAPVIVFCGVRFMAETAAILNPKAKVLLPVYEAGCPMADMITGEQLSEYKKARPDTVVVCYVNSSVEVKALSDICCTSSNAVKVLSSIPAEKDVLFVPDQNLGRWAASQAKRKVNLWTGYCPVHHWGFNIERVNDLRSKYPDHELLVHPESPKEVVDAADHVMSTGGMLSYAKDHDKLIIATEQGLTDYLNHIYPEKDIRALNPRAICKNMKKTSLTDVLHALQNMSHHIKVEEDIAQKAIHSLNRMMELL